MPVKLTVMPVKLTNYASKSDCNYASEIDCNYASEID